MKKPFSAILFLLLSFLLSANLNDARSGPTDYWKNIMKDQPIPEAIKDLFQQDPDAASVPGAQTKLNRFVKDFDVKPNVIIYHSHGHGQSEEGKSVTKNVNDATEEEGEVVPMSQKPLKSAVMWYN